MSQGCNRCIQILAKPECRAQTSKAKAEFLLGASQKCSAIETLFCEVDKFPDDFIRLLRAMVDGEKIDRERFAEMVAEIAPALKTPRGRKPTAASATHEFLLQHLRCGYTPAGFERRFQRCVDTGHTRSIFNPDFSPQAARRRVNARLNYTGRTALPVKAHELN